MREVNKIMIMIKRRMTLTFPNTHAFRIRGENHSQTSAGPWLPIACESGAAGERGYRGIPAGDALAPLITFRNVLVLVPSFVDETCNGGKSSSGHLYCRKVSVDGILVLC